MDINTAFPRQTLPYRSKGDKWRRSCVDWAASRTYFNYSPVRRNVVHMKVNYDLVNGIIHMEDVARILNPGDISTAFVPDKIQHYPIINSKLNTLRGENAARVFDWRVVVTNPYSVSRIEEDRRAAFNAAVQGIVEDTSMDDTEAGDQAGETREWYAKGWQDWREQWGNEVLRHYSKEQNFRQTFSDGFMDACISATEAYICGIVGGEPVLQRLNPMKLRIFGGGYSSRIEDADVIIYEDYWPRGRVIDTWYDELSEKDIRRLSDDIPDLGGQGPVGVEGAYNEARPFIPAWSMAGPDGVEQGSAVDMLTGMDGGLGSTLLPYDVAGNVRVLRVWWKSRRKIYKVKSYDPATGEEVFGFYPETYVPDTDAGEEAEALWVNEAWEGTKIGEDIYVGMRPCLVQHNSLDNPSRCHFGIVGTIYNLNEAVPYSLVDMMKPYSYLYDSVHAKLVDLIATNWGKLVELDLALKPKKWDVDKWMYFARANKVLIKDSFNEGSKGAATGKLAGSLNNASKGVVDADWGQSIQNYMTLLQWIKDSMSDLVGINRQREGNTYSRETVGGIERAVMQSSYITDWLFQQHEDTCRRVLGAFLDEAKGAMLGRSKKFQYILSDGTRRMMEVDGDTFAESDYGIVVDNSQDTQKLASSLDTLAQAALQNQLLDFSTLMRLYSSASMQEKMRMVEGAERKARSEARSQAQAQAQAEQAKAQAELDQKAAELRQKDEMNRRDNETKVMVAEINSRAEYMRLGVYADDSDKELRQQELDIDRERLRAEIDQFDKELRQKDDQMKQDREIELKKIEASKAKASSGQASTTKKK